tara:strand:+ start:5179 stop:8022 length:2844 start_codon:yes stop_codon:yes gene_type:complete
MTTMLLKNLISNLNPENAAIKINGISFDSRDIKKGNLFVSIKGTKHNGDEYIDQAISKGAKVIISSQKIKNKKKVIFIKTTDTRKMLAEIASRFFKEKPKNIVAVTGTNGKTSVSDFFYQIFNLQNKNVGFIGTLGFRKNNNLKTRKLTTLDSLTLNRDLAEMKKDGINNVIVEASSHGLKQKRLNFIKIKAGIFTNLSHDHLDYHKNMSDYLNSKLLLFKNLLKKNGTIITDTDIKQYKNIRQIKIKKKLKIDTIGSNSNTFKIINHKVFKNFQSLEIKYNHKIYKLKINLYGSVQIKNLLMAILASKVCGLKVEKIFKKIHRIKSVDGRLQLIRTLPNQSKIFLDYAHTPDALRNAILSLQEHFQKKITIIFGCGGERDKSKRIIMGRIAKKYCDKVYITDDNPRNENAKKIRKDIMKGLKNFPVKNIGDRKKAIINALKNSDPYEIILIAGKGHETYQDLGKRRIFFSDKNIVKNLKITNNNLTKKNNILKYNSNILNKILKTKKSLFFDNVSINSHSIKKNNLFVGIKGKKKDGNNFLNQAVKNGANYCITTKSAKENFKFIRVKNTMNFLNNLAKSKRNLSSAKFIAITGSSGKTTVKTIIGNLLKKYSETYFSPKSYNNQFGVPLSISNINPNHNFGVFELGMNKFNEINKLSRLVRPHIGLITNISEAHLENFKNIEGIAKAKSEIIYNIKKGGTIILNRDDKFFNYFKKIANKKNIKITSFGYSEKSDIRFISLIKKNRFFLLKIQINGKKNLIRINNANNNNIMNILSSIAVINELNLDLHKIKNFFKNQNLLEGRGKINKITKSNKKFYLIDESYNANPLSVKSAIQNFSNIQKNGKKKYFLFGDMLELGRNSLIYHKKISKLINNSDIDKTFVYGKKSLETYKFLKKNKKGEVVRDLKSFTNEILKFIKNGDFLMIKGSNATKLYELSNRFLGGAK